jgi:aminocarboxymuconate-semialdehyde decarboxylase
VKIDIHAHILPERWPNLKERYGYGGFINLDHHQPGAARMMRDDGFFFREIQENCWSPEAILRDMDQWGVDVMVLCTVPVLFYYWAQPQHTLDWSRFLNDHLADVQRAYPKRFIGLGTVPMQDIPLAIEEMTRCVRELGMPGLEIASHILDRNLDDPIFYPFYEAAQDLGACLLIHPWEMMGQDAMRKYWLPWLVGMPAETCRALCCMMFGGIFDRFPNLRVLFSHGGGSFAHTLGRIEHGYNCRPDLVNINNVRPPRSYLGHFWVDGITHDPDALRYSLKLFGSKRIAHGTDYPFPLGDLQHGRYIEEMHDLSTSTKNDIFFQSACEFLQIDINNYRR